MSVHSARMANFTVLHLHAEKTALHAVFQIAAGGGFTQSRRARDFVHRKAVQRMVAKEILYPRQRIPLYAFAAVILTVVFRLQLIQGVHVLLIDNLPHPLLFSELHKALK